MCNVADKLLILVSCVSKLIDWTDDMIISIKTCDSTNTEEILHLQQGKIKKLFNTREELLRFIEDNSSIKFVDTLRKFYKTHYRKSRSNSVLVELVIFLEKLKTNLTELSQEIDDLS